MLAECDAGRQRGQPCASPGEGCLADVAAVRAGEPETGPAPVAN